MREIILVGLAAATLLAFTVLSASAEDENPAALAKAFNEASVSLDQGLLAAARGGKPISGKFELADGALQLSVYSVKGDQSAEVIVDHQSGAIKKGEKITDGADLKAAAKQARAMAAAKVPLDQAVASAVASHSGYRAVSTTPRLTHGVPVADAMKGAKVKIFIAKLD
jgi:hypothetical protein